MKLMRKNGGFTLVELIVVIAILAILAGIAVPAYSGYIQKAEKAADMQLLGAVNSAFQAACMAEGTNAVEVGSASANVSAAGLVTEVTPYNDTFFAFFEGNENTAFKVIKALRFNAATGCFEEAEGQVKVTFGGVDFYISQEAADKLANSTFGEKIGSESLLGKVDSVSSIASGLLSGDSYSVIDKVIYGNDPDNPSEAYKEALAEQLDMHIDDLNDLLDGLEAQTPGAKNQFLANSLVLSAAKNTEGLDTSFLGTAGFANTLQNDLDDPTKAQGALAQAALAYGMYTSYANSSYGNDTLKQNAASLETSGGFGGLTSMLGDLEDPNFKAYMESDEGKADLEAYKSAMNIINESANQSPDATTGILVNGFQDEELSGLLGQIMGK